MLISTATAPSQTSMANPRQIAIYNSSSAVLYTVPAGRKFVGYIHGGSAACTYSVTPAGGAATTMRAGSVQLSYQSTTPAQIVLVAGTIITGIGLELNIFGVESDL